MIFTINQLEPIYMCRLAEYDNRLEQVIVLKCNVMKNRFFGRFVSQKHKRVVAHCVMRMLVLNFIVTEGQIKFPQGA